MTGSTWPSDWHDLTQGIGCEMCTAGRPEVNRYGIRVLRRPNADSYLQRARIQRGYTIVIWRGRHITEPTELSDEEAASYWRDVLDTARALIAHYRPLKMNYETLGNSLPHLHTHLVPRYRAADPRPGRPFPLEPQSGAEPDFSPAELDADVTALRSLLGHTVPHL